MIENIQKAYFIGIKGVGMTAFAQLLQHRGVAVIGSDTKEKFFTDDVLHSLDINFFEEFNKNNLTSSMPLDIVISSPAYIESENEEITEAKKQNIPIISWHQGLAAIFNQNYGIAVCGTHGKSTTAAMLGVILESAGLDPTVIVGGRVNQWGKNARIGESKYYVLETDEYKDAFLQYKPKIIAATNVEYDHPDYFKTREQYVQSFEKFFSTVDRKNIFTTPEEQDLENIHMSVLGLYNQKNANLAMNVAKSLGVDEYSSTVALQNFKGIARRGEFYGKYNGAFLYDDYAHHPTEIKALYNGIHEKYPEANIYFLFQPHTFSRTKEFLDEFVDSLKKPNGVGILHTYSSAREYEDDEIGRQLAKKLDAPYFSSHNEAEQYFRKLLKKKDILFSVGAGDGWNVVKDLSEIS